MRRFVRPETLFFLIAFTALLVIFRERGLNDPGTLWHTRVGELILTDGFMTTDPFTFTFAGKTWIPQQWGGEILMALLHRLGGFDAMLFAFLAIFAAAFTGVFRRLLAGGMGWPLAGAVTALALVAAGFHFYVRPHVFTIVFMVFVTSFIIDYDSKRRTWKHLLWLIPIHIVWTNLHGGMLGGVATLGLAIGVWIIAFVLKKDSPITSWKIAAILIGIVMACALTMFVNPIGLELQRTWFRLIGSKAMAQHVDEHSPMNLHRGGDLAVLGFAVLYLAALLAAGKPKLIWLIPLAWLALSVQSIRNGPLFVANAAVMLAEIWPHTFWFRRLRASGDTLALEPTPLPQFSMAAWLLPLAIVATGLALQHFRVAVPLIGSDWARFDPNYVPLDMIDAVQAIPPAERIYNDPNLGGFLIWNAPGRKIFMDDRFELCGDQWLNDYVETITEKPQRFLDWQRQYDFHWAMIVPEASPLLDHFIRDSREWQIVREGHTTILYRRK
jgi:hypothetical protein